MPLRRMPITNLTERDLTGLRDNQVSEGKTVDYKRDLVGPSDGDKLDFLKDVSALANTDGGDLIYGMDAKEGVPTELCGVAAFNADAEVLRLEEIILRGLKPRPFGIRFQPIALNSGRMALVTRVPKSRSAPHMITRADHGRFYARGNNGNYLMDVDEIRRAFIQGEDLADRIRKFRDRRIAVYDDGAQLRALKSPPHALLLHMVPFDAFKPGTTIDLSVVAGHWTEISLLRGNTSGRDFRYNALGFQTYAIADGKPRGATTQVFRNGIIEAALTHFLDYNDEAGPIIWAANLGPQIRVAVRSYLKLYNEHLEITPPIAMLLSLVSCDGAAIRIGPRYVASEKRIDDRFVLSSEAILDDYNVEPMRILKPALNAIWNAGDYEQAPYYDADGNWQSQL